VRSHVVIAQVGSHYSAESVIVMTCLVYLLGVLDSSLSNMKDILRLRGLESMSAVGAPCDVCQQLLPHMVCACALCASKQPWLQLVLNPII